MDHKKCYEINTHVLFLVNFCIQIGLSQTSIAVFGHVMCSFVLQVFAMNLKGVSSKIEIRS